MASGGVLLAVYWWLGVGGADGTARSTPRERVEFLLVAGAASVWAGGGVSAALRLGRGRAGGCGCVRWAGRQTRIHHRNVGRFTE